MSKPFQYKDRDGWFWEFRHRGQRYWGSADSYDDARQGMDAKRAEILRDETYEQVHGHKPFKVTPTPFADRADFFFANYCANKKSADRDKGILKGLKARWHGKKFADITPEDILNFRTERLKHRAPATVGQEIQVIRRLFKVAVELGWVAKSPAATVKKPRDNNTRVRFLEPDQMKALMDALPDLVRPLVIFARFTGARRGEILKLTWFDVDFKRAIITFRDTKNGENGTVQMNGTVRALLESLPRTASPRVFGDVREDVLRHEWFKAVLKARLTAPCPFCRGKVTRGSAEKRCRQCEGKGVKPDFRFHDLRHQAATDLLNLGANLNDVRDFLRHKSVAMTLRYAHLVKDHRAKTAALLDALAPTTNRTPTTGTGDGQEKGVAKGATS